MKKMTKAMLMTALILGSVSMGTAVEASELNTFALDEYVVTATRTLKEIQEVPASVSVVTAQDIEKKNAKSVRDALRGLPGVFNQPTLFSSMDNGLQMRGFGENNILVLVDGAQINTAYQGVADLNQIPVESIERIEVVRGAASSLYGGYAVGGVINITTKEAKKIGTTGEAVVTYGSHGTWKKALNVNSKVNDKWSFGLGYEQSESDGYVDSYITLQPSDSSGYYTKGEEVPDLKQLDNGTYLIGERGKRSWENENYNFNIKYNFDDSKSLKYSYSKTECESTYGQPKYYTELTNFIGNSGVINLGKDTQGGKVTPRTALGTNNDFERDVHNIVYNDTDNKFKVNVSYVDNKVDGFTQPASKWNSVVGYDFVGSGDITEHPSEVYNIDLEKAWENIGKHTIVVGATYKKEEMNQTKYDLKDWRDANSKDVKTSFDEGATENFALYVQDEYKINEPLTLYVGARLDYYEKGVGTFEDYKNEKFAKSSSEKYVEFSPKISLDYKADDKTNYYVSFSHAFNPPEMYKMYRRSFKSTKKGEYFVLPNPELEPETSDMFEIGVKKELSAKTRLGLALYHIKTKDKVSIDPIPLNKDAAVSDKRYENSGDETRHGIELELNHKFSDKYSAYLNYAWQQGEIVATDPVDNTDIPTHLLHAGVEYNCGKWNALLECEYISERNIAGANDWEGMGTREAMFLVNTAFNYEIAKDMTLQFGINNLFDKLYYSGEPIDGRNYYVGLRYNF